MKGLVYREWESYRRGVIPGDAPEVQVTECRRAFYAGAWALYSLLMNRMSGGDIVTSDDLNVMRSIDAELRAFKGRMAG